MKSNKRLIIGLALLLTGVAGLLAINPPMPMGGMGMMGQGNMKEMSQMGTILSPTDRERSVILSYLQLHAADVSSHTENMK